jgi:flagellar protein FliS
MSTTGFVLSVQDLRLKKGPPTPLFWLSHQSKREGMMNTPYARGAVSAYRRVHAGVALDGADAHGLVKLLLQGALDRITQAKGCMLHGNPEKGKMISSALAIVEELHRSLNFEAGGEIAQNLGRLYDYMQRRLLRAQLDTDASALDEVRSLLQEIKYAWDAVPEIIGHSQRRIADA